MPHLQSSNHTSDSIQYRLPRLDDEQSYFDRHGNDDDDDDSNERSISNRPSEPQGDTHAASARFVKSNSSSSSLSVRSSRSSSLASTNTDETPLTPGAPITRSIDTSLASPIPSSHSRASTPKRSRSPSPISDALLSRKLVIDDIKAATTTTTTTTTNLSPGPPLPRSISAVPMQTIAPLQIPSVFASPSTPSNTVNSPSQDSSSSSPKSPLPLRLSTTTTTTMVTEDLPSSSISSSSIGSRASSSSSSPSSPLFQVGSPVVFEISGVRVEGSIEDIVMREICHVLIAGTGRTISVPTRNLRSLTGRYS